MENKFTKMDELKRFIKSGRILIVADSNSQSKKVARSQNIFQKQKKCRVQSKRTPTHKNEEIDRSTFLNSRGNIVLTITKNNLIAAVNEWEISEEK